MLVLAMNNLLIKLFFPFFLGGEGLGIGWGEAQDAEFPPFPLSLSYSFFVLFLFFPLLFYVTYVFELSITVIHKCKLFGGRGTDDVEQSLFLFFLFFFRRLYCVQPRLFLSYNTPSTWQLLKSPSIEKGQKKRR